MAKTYKWTAQITVEIDPVWVADGFDLTQTRLQEIIREAFDRELPSAYGDEIKTACKILTAPDQKRIRIEQGYEAA